MSGHGTIAAAFFSLAAGFISGCGTGPIQAVGLDPAPLAAGMVAHWRFDDGSGTGVADASDNHHDGTIVGSTWSWTAGRFGGALHLQQGDYVSVENFPNATSGWTVAAWVQIPSQALGPDDATVISTEDAFKGGWEVLVTKTPAYHFGFWTGIPTPTTYAWAECSPCIHPDKWQHLAAAVDGKAMTLAFYVDGQLQTRQSIPQAILPGVATLYMGRWATTDPARLLLGSLDDIAIWSRTLSSAEIALLVEAAAP